MHTSRQPGDELRSVCRLDDHLHASPLEFRYQRSLRPGDDCGGKRELRKLRQSVVGPTRDDRFRTGFLERDLKVEREHGLILDNEDRKSAQIWVRVSHAATLEEACDT